MLYTNATAAVTVDLANGAADGDASVGHDAFSGVNSATGSAFDDSLSGAATNDSFVGLGGNDLMDGRGGFDTAIYNISTTAGISVNMASGTVTGDGSVGTDTLRNVEGVVGTNFNDTFVATGYGRGGALNVSSTQGDFNQFQGNAGNDTITGNGNTQILFTNATGGVTINLSTGIVTGDTSVGTDTITGGVFNVLGSNSGDTITGTSGADVLNGNGGNDTITGAGGNDTLTGGAGNDNFVFASGSTAGATITDFTGNGPAAGDTLEFHGFGLASDGATLTNISSTNQWLVHSGLGGPDEIITINGSFSGSIDPSDYHFLI